MIVAASDLDSLIDILHHKLLAAQQRPLNPTEIMILRGIWKYQTYNKIAIEAGYSPAYFTNVVAPELFKRLSQITGKRITKKNCRVLLESRVREQTITDKKLVQEHSAYLVETNDLRNEVIRQETDNSLPSYPSGSIPIDSLYYLKRSPVQEQAYAEIKKPGALIRIKAPQEMGKTSLLLRIVDYASRQGYRTVNLNLQQIDDNILSDLN